MKVESGTDTVSLVWMRVNMESSRPILADCAGTKLPMCARNTMSPTCVGWGERTAVNTHVTCDYTYEKTYDYTYEKTYDYTYEKTYDYTYEKTSAIRRLHRHTEARTHAHTYVRTSTHVRTYIGAHTVHAHHRVRHGLRMACSMLSSQRCRLFNVGKQKTYKHKHTSSLYSGCTSNMQSEASSYCSGAYSSGQETIKNGKIDESASDKNGAYSHLKLNAT